MYVVAAIVPILCSQAATAMMNAIIAGTALVLFTTLCLRLLPGLRPSNRFLVWTAVMMAAVLLPFFSLTRISASSSMGDTGSFHLDPRWAVGLVILWAFLAVIRLSRLIHSVVLLRRILAATTPIVPNLAIKSLLASTRHSELYASSDVDRPCVAGLFKPKIIFPGDLYPRLTPLELEQIVRHEMEHIRRRDHWTNLLQKIAMSIFPLNPVLPWIEHRLCTERELACDDCVLSTTASRKSYALCLANLAEHSFVRRNISLILGAWGRRSELIDRVHRILAKPAIALSRGASFTVTALVIAGLAGSTFWLTHVPTLISFSPQIQPSQLHATVEVTEPTMTDSVAAPRTSVEIPTFVKAGMDESLSAGFTSSRQHARVQIKYRERRHTSSQPLLRPARLKKSDIAHVTLTIYRMDSSYTAVAVESDWLFIQL